MSSGRIVSVCGGVIDVLLSLRRQKCPENIPDNVAFFGLYVQDQKLWAVASDGVYIIDKSTQPQFLPMPQYKSIGRMHVSFEFPDFVIIETAITSRRSTGGSVPMFVPKQ